MDDPVVSGGRRVHIVDDDPSVRTALSRLLGASGYEVRTYRTASEFLEEDVGDSAGCLVIDLRLPGLDGMQLHRRLLARDQRMPVIFLTGFGDIPTSVEAIKSGAFDFLEKPVAPDRLLDTVAKAFDASVRHQREAALLRDLTSRYESLTPRERQVFELLVAGRLNKQIATDLGIAEKTVKVHRARVMAKMGARRLAVLIRYASLLGLLNPVGESGGPAPLTPDARV